MLILSQYLPGRKPFTMRFIVWTGRLINSWTRLLHLRHGFRRILRWLITRLLERWRMFTWISKLGQSYNPKAFQWFLWVTVNTERPTGYETRLLIRFLRAWMLNLIRFQASLILFLFSNFLYIRLLFPRFWNPILSNSSIPYHESIHFFTDSFFTINSKRKWSWDITHRCQTLYNYIFSFVTCIATFSSPHLSDLDTSMFDPVLSLPFASFHPSLGNDSDISSPSSELINPKFKSITELLASTHRSPRPTVLPILPTFVVCLVTLRETIFEP